MIVARHFIRFGSLAFAIQLEDAMLDAFGLMIGNANEVDHRTGPAANQDLQRCHADPVRVLCQPKDLLVLGRQSLKIGYQFGHGPGLSAWKDNRSIRWVNSSTAEAAGRHR